MNKNLYNEPTFKVVNVNSVDVIATSINTTFGYINGFESNSSQPSGSTGEFNTPELFI